MKSMPPGKEDFYNLSKDPTSLEGLDARTGHDASFHSKFMEEDAGKRETILESEIRERNPKLYKLLKAELARKK
jgi:hypothetical protein